MADGWLTVLGEDDQELFLTEMDAALDACEAAGNAEPLEACLHAWRVTGEAPADPEARAVPGRPPIGSRL